MQKVHAHLQHKAKYGTRNQAHTDKQQWPEPI
jgi:hypothetical protein